MNRIDKLFQHKKNNILSVFYTAGYPQLNDTIPVAEMLEQAGADMIELGFPFSDPIADGPVIQQSNVKAISNGMNLMVLLQQVRELRKRVSLPVVLMGYVNPVMQYGIEKFIKDAAESGADGIIVPDLPVEEYIERYRAVAMQADLRVIFLVAPTTSDERIRLLDEISTGFLYAVSLSGVTGVRQGFSESQRQFLQRLQKLQLKNPVLAGFGISDAAGFTSVCQLVNGGIVGSAFIEELEARSDDLHNTISLFIKRLVSKQDRLT